MRAKTRPVPGRLAAANARRSWGRIAILVLLLGAAIFARAVSSVSQAGLESRIAATATGEGRPRAVDAVLWWPGAEFDLEEADDYLCGYLVGRLGGRVSVNYIEPVWAFAESRFGPTGHLTLVRVRPGKSYPEPWTEWYRSIEGRFPRQADEVAVPADLAERSGLEVGDRLVLGPLAGGSSGADIADQRLMTLTVSGVYTPLGDGPVFDYLLSLPEPGREDVFNLVAPRDWRTLGGFRSWMTRTATDWPHAPPAAGLPLVIGDQRPAEKAAGLAREVYGSQASTAMGMGFALVGVAVFIILLVSVHERRREVATYKLVGMDNLAATRVVGIELGLALGLAVLLAAAAYTPVALGYLPEAPPPPGPVYAGSVGITGPSAAASGFGAAVTLAAAAGAAALSPLEVINAFLKSALWTASVTALSAAYPLALTSAATPMQLLTGQRIFLFRRRRFLRTGWTDYEAGPGTASAGNHGRAASES